MGHSSDYVDDLGVEPVGPDQQGSDSLDMADVADIVLAINEQIADTPRGRAVVIQLYQTNEATAGKLEAYYQGERWNTVLKRENWDHFSLTLTAPKRSWRRRR